MRPFSPETPPEANRFTRFGKKTTANHLDRPRLDASRNVWALFHVAGKFGAAAGDRYDIADRDNEMTFHSG